MDPTIPTVPSLYQSPVRSDPPFAGNDESTVSGGDRSEVSRPIPSIEGFEFVRELGHGGMGTVYEVRDLQLGAAYALKMVRIDRFSPRMRERFRREAKAMLALDHPHIARFYTFGETSDGQPFFTMKLLAGGPLTDRLESDPRRVVDVMIKVCTAISYLHGRGMIHRDLKPQNILLDEFGEPFVSDFGLVKDWRDEPDRPDLGAPETASNDADSTPGSADGPERQVGSKKAFTVGPLGTPSYMSPEQLQHESSQIGPATDIWAMGVIIYELLCGRKPFEGDGVESMLNAISVKARPPSVVKPGLPAELDRIVMRCLTPDLTRRYASMDELAADLRRWRDGESRPRQPLWNRRSVLVALGLIGGAGVAGYFILNRDRRPAPGPTDFDKLVTDLKEKGEAALIGDGRLRYPGASRWIGGDAPELESADGVLRFQHPHTRLLELAKDLPFERYRLRVEMRHAHTSDKVGVYVGRSQFELPSGIEHCFFATTIDLITVGKENKQRTRGAVAACRDADPDGLLYAPWLNKSDNSTLNPDRWRTIEIVHSTDVSKPDERFGKVVVQIDGADFCAGDRTSLKLPEGKAGLAGRGEVKPTFLPADGLGFYVTRAKVDVRSAIILIDNQNKE